MRLEGTVAGMGRLVNESRVLDRNSKKMKLLPGRPLRVYENNVKIDRKAIYWDGVD
jgi:hypothetical protein